MNTPAVTALLRLEGFALLLASVALYAYLQLDWSTFAWCFLLPDAALFAYVWGPRAGALAYNSTHSTVGALAACFAGNLTDLSPAAGLIWLAHIGFDRALGYGLKHAQGFRHTHLGVIGRSS